MSDVYILQKELLLPGLIMKKVIMPVGTKAYKNGNRYEIDVPPYIKYSRYCFTIESVEDNTDWFLPEPETISQ